MNLNFVLARLFGTKIDHPQELASRSKVVSYEWKGNHYWVKTSIDPYGNVFKVDRDITHAFCWDTPKGLTHPSG